MPSRSALGAITLHAPEFMSLPSSQNCAAAQALVLANDAIAADRHGALITACVLLDPVAVVAVFKAVLVLGEVGVTKLLPQRATAIGEAGVEAEGLSSSQPS